MNYAEKKAMLESYGEISRSTEILSERIARLKSDRERITPILSDMPMGGGYDNRIEKLTIKIEELREKLGKRFVEKQEALEAIDKAINALESEREKNVLQKRYILLKTIAEIAEEMNLDERTIYRIEFDATRNLEA